MGDEHGQSDQLRDAIPLPQASRRFASASAAGRSHSVQLATAQASPQRLGVRRRPDPPIALHVLDVRRRAHATCPPTAPGPRRRGTEAHAARSRARLRGERQQGLAVAPGRWREHLCHAVGAQRRGSTRAHRGSAQPWRPGARCQNVRQSVRHRVGADEYRPVEGARYRAAAPPREPAARPARSPGSGTARDSRPRPAPRQRDARPARPGASPGRRGRPRRPHRRAGRSLMRQRCEDLACAACGKLLRQLEPQALRIALR